jgi:hypothetical protein
MEKFLAFELTTLLLATVESMGVLFSTLPELILFLAFLSLEF